MTRALILLAAAGCASAAATTPTATTPHVTKDPAPRTSGERVVAPRSVHEPRPDTAAIFARLQPDLLRCYVLGLKSTPEMTAGKVTLNASIDAAGSTTCVVPSDGTGITQEVSDCMSARLAKEKFDDGPAWTFAVPVVLHAGAVELGERSPDVFGIESIETVRMPDAFDRAESLLPQLEACLRGVDRSGGLHRILVGARVAADGRTECALAISAGALPAKAGDCSAAVLRNATFPPPKRGPGPGLVLVPINLLD